MTFPPTHTQIIHFDNGTRVEVSEIVRVWTGTWTHLICKNGDEHVINPHRVLHFTIPSDK